VEWVNRPRHFARLAGYSEDFLWSIDAENSAYLDQK